MEEIQTITKEMIEQAWRENQENMSEYVKEVGGVKNAIIKVLAQNPDISRILFEGRGQVDQNDALRQKYIARIAKVFELDRQCNESSMY